MSEQIQPKTPPPAAPPAPAPAPAAAAPAEAAPQAPPQPDPFGHLPNIRLKKTNKFIMNSGNTEVSVDGLNIRGVQEVSVSLTAPSQQGAVGLAVVTLKIVARVDFDQVSDEEIAAAEAKAKLFQEEVQKATAAALAAAAPTPPTLPRRERRAAVSKKGKAK